MFGIDGDLIVSIVTGIILMCIYFLPTIIAVAKDHKQMPALVVINILTGWTFIGYLIALVWSLWRYKKEEK